MIVRCAKCRDLLAYNSKLSSQVVDRCINGCDAGVTASPEDTEVVEDCWYKADAETLQKLRVKEATPEVYCEGCGVLMVIEWSRDEKGDCILAHRCKCEKITTCWYMEDCVWRTGFFHGWSSGRVERDLGPCQLPAAIIEDATNSRVHVVYAGLVSFSPDHPDHSENKS